MVLAPVWVTLLVLQGPVEALLHEGKLTEAVERIESAGRIASDAERLKLAAAVVDAVAAHGERPLEAKRRTLLCALDLLHDSVLPAQEAVRDRQRQRAGVALAALLKPLVHGARSRAFGDYLAALREAHDALLQLGQRDSQAITEVRLQLLPALLDAEKYSETQAIAREALKGKLDKAAEQEVRRVYGLALLGGNRVREALPFLDAHLDLAPHSPSHVLPIANQIPLDYGDDLFRILRPVITARPTAADQKLWTQGLSRFYLAVEAELGGGRPQRGAVADWYAGARIELKVPTVWPRALWGEGFRVWRPDGAVAGKQYSGKHALFAVLPASRGWAASKAPPAELRRWRNCALCLHHPSGTALVVYWFAPDLYYWYGTTPRQRGVTGKKVRGSTRGGIARLVADAAYGEATHGGGPRFVKHGRPLPLRGRLPSAIRQHWQAGDLIQEETFFSLGQVTCEVLLRVREADYQRLEPEIRWLYSRLETR